MLRYILLGVLCTACSPAAASLASFYHETQGIACGPGRFNPEGMTAAHRTLPCGTKVKVTRNSNGKSVVVTINDRGPALWTHRDIDLSRRAAEILGFIQAGVTKVTMEVLELGQATKRMLKHHSKRRGHRHGHYLHHR